MAKTQNSNQNIDSVNHARNSFSGNLPPNNVVPFSGLVRAQSHQRSANAPAVPIGIAKLISINMR